MLGRTENTVKIALCAGHAGFAVLWPPAQAYVLQDLRQILLLVNATQGTLEMDSHARVVLGLAKPSKRATVRYLMASHCMMQTWIANGS